MASATTLVLKNAAGANVNYYPVKIQTGQLARYVDRSNPKLALQHVAQLNLAETTEQRRVFGKVDYRVENATTGVIKTGYGEFAFRFPAEFTLTDRQEVGARLRAAINDAIVTAATENGETPW